MNEPKEMNQVQINTFCRAASAAYYAIVAAHARRTGEPAMLPDLLCPKGLPPRPCQFTDRQLDEAEAFLVRLGGIGER